MKKADYENLFLFEGELAKQLPENFLLELVKKDDDEIIFAVVEIESFDNSVKLAFRVFLKFDDGMAVRTSESPKDVWRNYKDIQELVDYALVTI